MTVQQLKYIVTVAETGSITEAAKQLFISQPSLSNAVKEIEKEVGITIFLRSHAGITLTVVRQINRCLSLHIKTDFLMLNTA